MSYGKRKCEKCGGTRKCPRCKDLGHIIIDSNSTFERGPEWKFENRVERTCPTFDGTGKCPDCNRKGYIEK